MRSAEQYVGRPESIATVGKPFATPSLARACGRDAAESLEDADAYALRSVGRRCAAGSDRAWLRDRRQAPRRASTLQLDEDGPAWWHRDDLSYPITRLHRNQRRRHHVAPMAEACELPINAIAAGSGLITKRQRPPGTPETVAQLADRTRIIGNLAEGFHGTRASALRHRDRDPFFVNIQANKSGMFHEARLLCMRLCTGHPA